MKKGRNDNGMERRTRTAVVIGERWGMGCQKLVKEKRALGDAPSHTISDDESAVMGGIGGVGGCERMMRG